MQDRGPSAYVAEFIGTFFLVFFITAAVSLYVSPPPAFSDFGTIGLVHALALFVLISAFSVASGAHFNPAVTVAMTALRQMKPADAGIYVITQLAGGVAGALVTKLLLDDEGGRTGVNYGAPAVNPARFGDAVILPGMVAEFLGTFLLVLVIVGVAVHSRSARDTVHARSSDETANPRSFGETGNPWSAKETAALAIGATFGVAAMVIAPLTGASFNPARAFGPALVAGEFGGVGNFILVFVVAPILGAVAAAAAYFSLYVAPGKKGVGGMEPVD